MQRNLLTFKSNISHTRFHALGRRSVYICGLPKPSGAVQSGPGSLRVGAPKRPKTHLLAAGLKHLQGQNSITKLESSHRVRPM